MSTLCLNNNSGNLFALAEQQLYCWCIILRPNASSGLAGSTLQQLGWDELCLLAPCALTLSAVILLLTSARRHSDALRLLRPQLSTGAAAPLLLQLQSVLRSSSAFPFLLRPQIHLILKLISSGCNFWDGVFSGVSTRQKSLPAARALALPCCSDPELNCFSPTEGLFGSLPCG